MDRKEPSERRRELLDAAIDHVAANGIGDLSLRGLAGAIGTSHRMLIHHFGSKEKLFIEIIRTVEQRQRDAFDQLQTDPDLAPDEAARQMWRQVSDPELWANERLFFEIYGQALQGRPEAVPVLDGIVDSWLDPVAAAQIALGVDPVTARAAARLGLAVTRGLLLDLLATGDRAGNDGAMELFIAMYMSMTAAAREPGGD